mmetsp:Transcript_15226/g.29430  ORF Transcript_15226/g.29430 Transcript_15226/m.29430 type:complete len:253 (-) Transcript_15226:343-1101(-)
MSMLLLFCAAAPTHRRVAAAHNMVATCCGSSSLALSAACAAIHGTSLSSRLSSRPHSGNAQRMLPSSQGSNGSVISVPTLSAMSLLAKAFANLVSFRPRRPSSSRRTATATKARLASRTWRLCIVLISLSISTGNIARTTGAFSLNTAAAHSALATPCPSRSGALPSSRSVSTGSSRRIGDFTSGELEMVQSVSPMIRASSMPRPACNSTSSASASVVAVGRSGWHRCAAACRTGSSCAIANMVASAWPSPS